MTTNDMQLDLTGYQTLATGGAGRYLVFSDLFSWRLRVYDLQLKSELVNNDPDIERFILDDYDRLHDLDLGTVTVLRFVGDAK